MYSIVLTKYILFSQFGNVLCYKDTQKDPELRHYLILNKLHHQ